MNMRSMFPYVIAALDCDSTTIPSTSCFATKSPMPVPIVARLVKSASNTRSKASGPIPSALSRTPGTTPCVSVSASLTSTWMVPPAERHRWNWRGDSKSTAQSRRGEAILSRRRERLQYIDSRRLATWLVGGDSLLHDAATRDYWRMPADRVTISNCSRNLFTHPQCCR
jgi:hypothetical protein